MNINAKTLETPKISIETRGNSTNDKQTRHQRTLPHN